MSNYTMQYSTQFMVRTFILLNELGSVLESFLNGPTPASFMFNLGLFKQTIQFVQQINVKNVHLVYVAGI